MIAVIEMTKGTTLKYEHDKLTGALIVDRVINQEIPFNYGYLIDSLSEDGDPLDVFVLGDQPIFPLARVRIVPVAIINCTDNGVRDDKIVAEILGDLSYHSLSAVETICKYLESYKTGFKVLSVDGFDKAMDAIYESENTYEASLGGKT